VSVLVRHLATLSPDGLFLAQSSRVYTAQGPYQKKDTHHDFHRDKPSP
jgi:hypothetical protein